MIKYIHYYSLNYILNGRFGNEGQDDYPIRNIGKMVTARNIAIEAIHSYIIRKTVLSGSSPRVSSGNGDGTLW